MPDSERLKRIADRLRRADEIDQDLRAAKKRQLHMLPELPDLDGIEMAASFKPLDDVGGDFYDVIRIGGHMMGVLVADVAGHGVEAAIIMGMAMKAFSIYARGVASPSMVMKSVNSELHRDLRGELFLTCAYAVFDERRGTLRLARAGHTPPILYRPSDSPRARLLEPGGMAVGFDPGDSFDAVTEETVIKLEAGDTLVLYTDGLTEAKPAGGAEFGEERLLELIEGAGDLPPAELIERLTESVEGHLGGAPQADDWTAIAVKMTG